MNCSAIELNLVWFLSPRMTQVLSREPEVLLTTRTLLPGHKPSLSISSASIVILPMQSGVAFEMMALCIFDLNNQRTIAVLTCVIDTSKNYKYYRAFIVMGESSMEMGKPWMRSWIIAFLLTKETDLNREEKNFLCTNHSYFIWSSESRLVLPMSSLRRSMRMVSRQTPSRRPILSR